MSGIRHSIGYMFSFLSSGGGSATASVAASSIFFHLRVVAFSARAYRVSVDADGVEVAHGKPVVVAVASAVAANVSRFNRLQPRESVTHGG
jgi:hypothetical protein